MKQIEINRNTTTLQLLTALKNEPCIIVPTDEYASDMLYVFIEQKSLIKSIKKLDDKARIVEITHKGKDLLNDKRKQNILLIISLITFLLMIISTIKQWLFDK